MTTIKNPYIRNALKEKMANKYKYELCEKVRQELEQQRKVNKNKTMEGLA